MDYGIYLYTYDLQRKTTTHAFRHGENESVCGRVDIHGRTMEVEDEDELETHVDCGHCRNALGFE